MQEVVVTGIRASLAKAINIKRNSDDIVDAISAEDIGKLPDRNVADALQRIPGVNTYSAASGEGGFDENDRISIRGTPPSLTEVTIDGHPVSTGDWFIEDQYQTVGRSVSFTLLPSEIVDNAVVYKSQDASMIEGGVAGSVDIQTKSPLSLSKPITMEASFEGAYNSLTGTTKPQINAMLGWKNADETFGIIVDGFYEERDVRRYGQEVLGWSPLSGPTACMQGATNVGTPTLSGGAYSCATGTLSGGNPITYAHANTVGAYFPTLIGSSLFEQQRIREGGNAVVQWRPSDQFELKFSAFYSDLSASNYNANYMLWGSNLFGSVAPTSYTMANNTITGAVFPNQSAVNSVVVDNLYRKNAESNSGYFNLDGTYKPNDRLTIKGQIGYTRGVGDTPQAPSYESDGFTGASYAPSGNGFAVSFPNLNTSSPSGLANDWAWNESFKAVDTEFYGKVDVDYRIDDGLWKDVQFGFRGADHTRNVEAWDRGCALAEPTGTNDYNCSGDFAAGTSLTPLPFSAIDPTGYPSGYNGSALGIPGLLVPIAGSPSAIYNIINGITDPARGSTAHTVQAENYYWQLAFKVHETDYAAYTMARVGGDRWRANFGVRLAITDENDYVNEPESLNPSPTGAGEITTSAFGPYFVDNVKHTYVDILPSVNLTFDVKKNLQLRFSAEESMSRPDYSALGGTVSLTNTNLTGNGGNANLKPIKADTYDVGVDWYYNKLSLLSLDVFYMDLQSYVSFGNYQGSYVNTFLTGNSTTPVYSTYTISAPQNTSGQVQGFEVALQQPIKYGFGFLANYTYADGEDVNGNPIVGDSKDTFNVTGYYEAHGFSARLAYTWRSHVYIGLNEASAENQASIGSLDAAVNYNIGKNITLTAQGLNLTNELIKYYANNPTQVRAVYDNGSQAYVGIRFKY